MSHLQLTQHIDAPVERVWELGIDFKRYPEWNVSYTDVREIQGPPDKVGTRIHSEMRLLGRKMHGWAEIIEVEPLRLMKITGTSEEGGKLTYTNRATPVAGGTDLETEVDYEVPFGIFGQIVDKLFVERTVERDLRHSMENFKALAEAKVPAPA